MAATNLNVGHICFICGSHDPQCIEDVYQWKLVKVCRAQCIIGRDIPVCRQNFYWEVGRVIEFDVNSSKHCISFFDETEWLTLDKTPMATYLNLYKEQHDAAKAKQPPECQFKSVNMSPTSMIHYTPRQTLPLSPPEKHRPPGSESLMAVSSCMPYARDVQIDRSLFSLTMCFYPRPPCLRFLRRCSLLKEVTVEIELKPLAQQRHGFHSLPRLTIQPTQIPYPRPSRIYLGYQQARSCWQQARR